MSVQNPNEEPDGPMPMCFSPETYRAEVARRKAAERRVEELSEQVGRERSIADDNDRSYCIARDALESTRMELAETNRRLSRADAELTSLRKAYQAAEQDAYDLRGTAAAQPVHHVPHCRASKVPGGSCSAGCVVAAAHPVGAPSAAAQPVARGREVERYPDLTDAECRLALANISGVLYDQDGAIVPDDPRGYGDALRRCFDQLREANQHLIDRVRALAAPPVRDETPRFEPGDLETLLRVVTCATAYQRAYPGALPPDALSDGEVNEARMLVLTMRRHLGYAPPPQPTPDAALREALRRRIEWAERLQRESAKRDPADRDGFVCVIGDILHNLRAVESEAAALAGTPPADTPAGALRRALHVERNALLDLADTDQPLDARRLGQLDDALHHLDAVEMALAGTPPGKAPDVETCCLCGKPIGSGEEVITIAHGAHRVHRACDEAVMAPDGTAPERAPMNLRNPNEPRARSRADCEIIEDFMPKWRDAKPIVAVRVAIDCREYFLRHSKGPLQGHFLDMYPDDYQRRDLAELAIAMHLNPPRIDATRPPDGMPGEPARCEHRYTHTEIIGDQQRVTCLDCKEWMPVGAPVDAAPPTVPGEPAPPVHYDPSGEAKPLCLDKTSRAYTRNPHRVTCPWCRAEAAEQWGSAVEAEYNGPIPDPLLNAALPTVPGEPPRELWRSAGAGRVRMVGADDSSLYFVYPHYADDEDGSVEHYGVTIDNTAAHPTIDAAMRSAERHLAKVRAAPPTPPRTPVERGNAEWLASYHAERAGYGGASREFHMRAETWVRDHARPPVERPNEVMAQAIARAASWAEYMLGTMGDVLHIDVKAELKGHRDSMRAALDGIPDWRDRPSGASVEPPATEQYDCPCGAWTLAHAHGWGWMTRRPPGVGEASAFVPGSGWVDLAEHDAAVRAEGVVSALESLTRMGVMSGGQAEALCELLKIPPPNRPRTPAPTPEEPTP